MTAKDLKNALLQEAVQGKLVPQIASEGNARDLLEEIRKERGESLPLATAHKRSSATPSAGTPRNAPMEISEDEIPFDIPESWCWCRLSEYVDIRDGTHDSPKYVENGYPFITSKNLQNGKLDFNNVKYISEEDHKKICARSNVETGDILYSMIGGNIGKPVMVIKDREFSIKNVALFKPYSKETYMKYILFYLDAITEELRKIASGGCQPFVGLNVFRNWNFPLPPLAEQKRIVAAIEKFMPLIEEYGKKETVLNELNAQIGTLTKKAILQEAVQGKLVPQIPAEGSAKDLLEQIKAQKAALIKEGKIKKDKAKASASGRTLPEITEDEIPFDIPENWCWCRLGEICKFLSRGKSPKYSEIKKYPVFAQKCNLKDGEISLDQAQFLDPEVLPKWKEEYKIQDGDVLVNSTGTGTVMRTRYFKSEYLGNYPFVVPDSHVTVIRTFPEIDSKYIFYCCFGFAVQKYWEENLAGSTNQKELYIGVVGNTPIPLPPLSEQKRIVAAIEQLLPLCEKLGK